MINFNFRKIQDNEEEDLYPELVDQGGEKEPSREEPKLGNNEEEDSLAELVAHVGEAVQDKSEQILVLSNRLDAVSKIVFEDEPEIVKAIKRSIAICR